MIARLAFAISCIALMASMMDRRRQIDGRVISILSDVYAD